MFFGKNKLKHRINELQQENRDLAARLDKFEKRLHAAHLVNADYMRKTLDPVKSDLAKHQQSLANCEHRLNNMERLACDTILNAPTQSIPLATGRPTA